MAIKDVQVTFRSKSNLLMHADNVMAADVLKDVRKSNKGKKDSVAGDDRSPAWSWKTYLYHDGTNLAIPAINLMACFRDSGKKVIMEKQKTFKAATQFAILLPDEFLTLRVDGKPITKASIDAIDNDAAFPEHVAAVEKLGFALHIVRAKVGTAKHVRVRPCFRNWSLVAKMQIDTDYINIESLEKVLKVAGMQIGLGDWRPGSPMSPGQHGRFVASVE